MSGTDLVWEVTKLKAQTKIIPLANNQNLAAAQGAAGRLMAKIG